ncbi:hypothetical protein [Cellulomonas sp. URHD0024]|uniref:hypothetical protein n=1 Tax=Cellulomonas sp. URHD0024 TaxID=1302620 RepID=UPI0003F7BCCF|nr:hypothetical protein [Cellulomonas sp. URHD0024]
MSTTLTGDRPRVRRGPVDLTARWFLATQLRVALWFWGIAVVVSTIAVAIYATVADVVERGVVQFGMQALVWLPMSFFIGTALTSVPVQVASGLTRRALARGALVAAIGTGIGYGAAYAVLMSAERAVYGAFGWHWSVGVDGATPAAFLIACATTFVASNVSGLLVGIVYLRGGGWWGTLTLPLTVGPVVALTAMVATADAQLLFLLSGIGILVAMLTAIALDRLVRGAAVPPKK